MVKVLIREERMKKGQDKGQSLIEAVFAIGVIGLTLTGVVSLLVFNLSARTKSFDRKKATELGEKVMERLVWEKRDSPLIFWQLVNVSSSTDPNFDGYVYSVGYTNVVDGVNCGVGTTDCAQVHVRVGWSGSTDQSLEFNRFFSRK